MTLVAVGLAMVAYGGTLWLGDRLGFSGDHHVIALAATLAALGLLVLGLGVAGWRTGFVGVLAILTALATLGSGAVADGARWGGRVGDVTWTPTAARPGRRPQQLPDRRRRRPASTCGACRSTVWPTPPSPPGWGWAS